MKKILQQILKYLARKILQKYKPEVIAITGSVGKTSAKETIHTVLMNTFLVQQNIKNYNNELGVPLTIIGAEAAGKNIFKWLGVFLKAVKLLMSDPTSPVLRTRLRNGTARLRGASANYPKVLILELAVDKPGDMDYLLDFVKPRIGVLTRIGPVHLEFFGTQEKILQEKSKLIKALPQNGFAVLNYDYKDVLSLCDITKAKCITYGFDEGADVRAKNILYGRGPASTGASPGGQTTFTLEYGDKTSAVVLLRAAGKPQIYAILAGICCGIVKGMDLEKIKEALKSYVPPKGRGNVLKGIKNTLIIDETYNASPQAVEAALENLARLFPPTLDKGGIRGGRSVAVLGDMLELGPITRDAHLSVGKKAAELELNYLFTVGLRAKDIARGAREAGMIKDRIFEFSDNLSLGKFLQEKIEEGDIILVKGSQGARMEKVVKEIMAEPERAHELLVRQDKQWQV